MVALRAHYEYAAGRRFGASVRSGDLGQMANVPPFELVSRAVEFRVVRPLDVVVKVKRPLKADVRTRLSEIISVELVNRSPEPIECSSPTLTADARLTLEFAATLGWLPRLTEQQTTYGTKRLLRPGESVELLGPGVFANGLDGVWVYPRAETVRLRAGYIPSTWKSSGEPHVKSEWVDIRVEP